MPIDRLQPNQVINRQARVLTQTLGQIDCITLGEIANAVSTTTLPTGQTRTTGQPQATDVTGSIMFADAATLQRVESWKNKAKAGAADGIQRGVTVQYYKEDGTPGPQVYIEECHVHTVTYPSTDVSASGDGAQVSFVMSVFNANHLPGTA